MNMIVGIQKTVKRTKTFENNGKTQKNQKAEKKSNIPEHA